ncbi:DUF167 domain-containing protein [Paludibacterium paludis]|uniref:UPF0235 protein GCM10011289_10930 n=1 Tax=Paludibacterium paludis TaxID=1225769 RepID=A0A918P083_9NEIS|nr:DUF167 domain-containing protein [Paludibacterium paludis]GGY09849.1 UPF0235 protein [Paludibacterium paludis]
MKSWITPKGDALRLTLYVQPGARKTEVAGEHGGALKIRLAAPPVDGKANEALQTWLADSLGIPRRSVRLVSGEKNRNKVIDIEPAMPTSDLLERLGLQ